MVAKKSKQMEVETIEISSNSGLSDETFEPPTVEPDACDETFAVEEIKPCSSLPEFFKRGKFLNMNFPQFK